MAYISFTDAPYLIRSMSTEQTPAQYITIAKIRVGDLIKAHGLTQDLVASITGASASSVSRYLSLEHRAFFDVEQLAALSHALGLPITQVLPRPEWAAHDPFASMTMRERDFLLAIHQAAIETYSK